MRITYLLKRDIVSRTAINLVFELANTKNIHIIKNKVCFNGKSLIGVLSNHLRAGDVITFDIEDLEDIRIVKESLEELGEVIE